MSKVQDDAKSQGSRKSGKLHSAIEKAQAIQQREQLRTMICDKFNKDFSKGNKAITKLIEEIVTDYFSKEKITEESLRVLKQNVSRAVDDYRKDNKSGTHRSIQKKARHRGRISNKETMMKSVARLLRSVARHHLKKVRRQMALIKDPLGLQVDRQKLAQLLQNQSTRLTEMMRMNGPLL